MQENACQNNTSSQQPAVTELIESLTTAQRRQLHRFAEHRLRRITAQTGSPMLLAGWSAEDLVQTVLAKFLLGETHPKKGRHLAQRHRHDSATFLNALLGAVNSELQNLIRSAEASTLHLPIGTEDQRDGALQLAGPEDQATRLQERDFTSELLRRLGAAATPSQTAIVQAMAAGALNDDDPALEAFDRRRVHEVRQTARRILHELESDIRPAPPEIDLSL
jgi:hypothetical protein